MRVVCTLGTNGAPFYYQVVRGKKKRIGKARALELDPDVKCEAKAGAPPGRAKPAPPPKRRKQAGAAAPKKGVKAARPSARSPLQCEATTKAGTRCKNTGTLAGGRVFCHVHAKAAPKSATKPAREPKSAAKPARAPKSATKAAPSAKKAAGQRRESKGRASPKSPKRPRKTAAKKAPAAKKAIKAKRASRRSSGSRRVRWEELPPKLRPTCCHF